MTPASGAAQSTSTNPLAAGVCKLNWTATQRLVHGFEELLAIHIELAMGASDEQKWWLLSLRGPAFVPEVHKEEFNPFCIQIN
jgi:hypothetical protein